MNPSSLLPAHLLPPDVTILSRLLEARDGGHVSGNLLANELGISRVGVWNRLDNLREQGFIFDAVRNRGYRLITEPTEIHQGLLQAYLVIQGVNPPIFFHNQVDSTNSEAERRLADGAATPFAVIARTQSKGRGRRGRHWESSDRGNLYLSVAFKPDMPLVKMRLFTLCAALRICQLLRGEQLQTRVKWPNDLLVDGKKLGGMLTEARVDTDIMRDLIFGLGLNLNSRASDLPEALRATATSAADHLGTLPSINRLGASILKTVLDVYEECQESELGERLVKDWSEMDGIRGERITARAGREKIEGIAAGITPDGALVIETTEGRQHFILSGDATLSPEQ